ncbi:Transcription elongation factor A protein 1 [Amazona aestiva]|uniref:Transcription elongation factor A protein 1 n=1 Tax=Amazona aestiva TaxID=12930 RepID=A0A0Q3TV87_AMAAE|nr:Transcription elongation factor A protein 1 [Amazona aestiva]
MTTEDEIIRIAKKMDKMVQKKNAAGALDLLKELKNIPMTLELLQSTRIGMSVNAIRKQSTDEEVTSLAKSLIKSWKKLLDGPSTDKDSEEKKKEPASSSQNSPEAREERCEVLRDYTNDLSINIKLEMASDELKEMRKNLTKEAIREHQMAKTGVLLEEEIVKTSGPV